MCLYIEKFSIDQVKYKGKRSIQVCSCCLFETLNDNFFSVFGFCFFFLFTRNDREEDHFQRRRSSQRKKKPKKKRRNRAWKTKLLLCGVRLLLTEILHLLIFFFFVHTETKKKFETAKIKMKLVTYRYAKKKNT